MDVLWLYKWDALVNRYRLQRMASAGLQVLGRTVSTAQQGAAGPDAAFYSSPGEMKLSVSNWGTTVTAIVNVAAFNSSNGFVSWLTDSAVRAVQVSHHCVVSSLCLVHLQLQVFSIEGVVWQIFQWC
jgi:hypothetical protein